MTSHRELHRHHDFTVLWIGQTVSELGTRVSMFVLPLVTFALTGSTLLAGLAGALDLLGMALVLLPAGVLADRVDRKRLMRGAAAAGTLLYASLVVAGVLGALSLPHLFGVAFLTGVAAGLLAPAEASAVRTVVPDELLPTALSQLNARQRVADLGGGPLGGLLYAAARWAPFLFDALSFALAWVLLGRLHTDLSPARTRDAAGSTQAAGQRRRARADVVEGFRFVWSRPLFRTLAVWAMASNLAVNALFTAATLRLVQAGFPAWQIGLVDTAAGVCGVLGAVVAPWLVDRLPTGWLTVAVAWSFVPLLVPMVLVNDPWVVALALSVGVFLNPAGNAGIGAYRMAVTPPELVGRVQSVSQFTSWSVLPLAPVLAGVLLSVLGGEATIAALAVLLAGVALLPTLARSVRSVPRPADWPRAGAEEHRTTDCRCDPTDWEGAGGGQRLRPGPQAGPQPEGSVDRALEPAGAPARHA